MGGAGGMYKECVHTVLVVPCGECKLWHGVQWVEGTVALH